MVMATSSPVSFWRDRAVLVTGCTGLLGSWLTHELLTQGAQVVGLIRDGVPKTNFVRLGLRERMGVVQGPLEDYALLERTLNEYEIEAVFHLAAQTIVGTANRSPLSTFEANIRGTWNLLEACRNSPLVQRVLVASSDKAYGAQPDLPYREEAPLQGRHPYDVSKSCADLIAQAYWHTYRLPVCVTRCGNLFGGGDLNFSRIVPGTIRSALRDEEVVIRSDGRMRRDYIYVQDAVDGYLLLAEKMLEAGCRGEAFNFSQERPQTVIEMAAAILRLMGQPERPLRILGQTHGEIPDQFLAADKARGRLGWAPRRDFEQGLRETIAWYEEYFRD